MNGDAKRLLPEEDLRPARASRLPGLLPCPACWLPAEVTERFRLASTDGPVDHIAVACVAGHFFKMAVDRLPEEARACLETGTAGHGECEVALRAELP